MPFRVIIIYFITFFAHSLFAINPRIEQLVRFETKANAVSTRSTEMIKLSHLEIPIKYVEHDFAKRTDFRISKSLIFEKAGVKYVRWILNPEDTVWGDKVIEYFKTKHKLVLEKKYYFEGYQTSSRSYIAEDPFTKAQFSVKSSTNVTGGNWTDKKQPFGEAVDSRLMSDFLYNQKKKRPFKHFVFMDEPAMMGIKEIDQAVVVRDLNEIKRPDRVKYYLPGFSALHEEVGKEIAAKNGSSDPYLYWTENYIKVAGRALGELAARTGLQFDSPHSQNFLIELDHAMKPTGRLVLRDMADLYVDRSFIQAIEGENSPILHKFTQKGNIVNSISAGFGPLHGNSKPSWVLNSNDKDKSWMKTLFGVFAKSNQSKYQAWMSVFFNEFELTFKEISGYDLKLVGARHHQSGDYFSADYRLGDKSEFKGFYDSLKKLGYIPAPTNSHISAPMCSRLFVAKAI